MIVKLNFIQNKRERMNREERRYEREVVRYMKKVNKIKPNSLVVAYNPYVQEMTQEEKKQYYHPFKEYQMLMYLGEIQNFKGHGVYADCQGKVHFSHHIENFKLYDHDEDYKYIYGDEKEIKENI